MVVSSTQPDTVYYNTGASIYVRGPYIGAEPDSIFYNIGAFIFLKKTYTDSEPMFLYYSMGSQITAKAIPMGVEPDTVCYSMGAEINIEANYTGAEPNSAYYSMGASVKVIQMYRGEEPDAVYYSIGAMIETKQTYLDKEPDVVYYELGAGISVEKGYADVEPNVLYYGTGAEIKALPFNITVATNDATDVDDTSATLQGTLIHDEAQVCTLRFQYGLDTSYGTNTTDQMKTAGQFSFTVRELKSNTLYHYRAYASTGVRSMVGLDKTFLTEFPPGAPIQYVNMSVFPSATANITITPSDWDGEGAGIGENGTSAMDAFTIENTGDIQVDVTIWSVNTSVWHLATSPAHNQFQLQWNMGDWTNIGLLPTAFISNLAGNAMQGFGMRVFMPTSSSININQMATITFSATAD